MNLLIEVAENGILKLKSPSLSPGTAFVLPVETEEQEILVRTQWDALESALDKAAKLDIPRRTHEDILNQLRSYRV